MCINCESQNYKQKVKLLARKSINYEWQNVRFESTKHKRGAKLCFHDFCQILTNSL